MLLDRKFASVQDRNIFLAEAKGASAILKSNNAMKVLTLIRGCCCRSVTPQTIERTRGYALDMGL
jgi:hypothetical protein